MRETNKNVAIAFAVVIGAGCATALGAAIVFVPRLVKYANRSTLACALGFSAGVMTYVSFIEIFKKSVTSFSDAGNTIDNAYKFATVCFFGGVVLMIILNFSVSFLLRGNRHDHSHHDLPPEKIIRNNERERSEPCNDEASSNNNNKQNETETSSNKNGLKSINDEEKVDDEDQVSPCHCCSDDPVRDLDRIQYMGARLEEQMEEDAHNRATDDDEPVTTQQSDSNDVESGTGRDAEQKKIMRMSINTAVAIALHNFPEGLATFVATLNSPKVGFVLAIAIAIHNIPEGICVALPIYYATGNRWLAFRWAVLSGISEPIAALLGWLILASAMTETTYAILFGLVAGMMVIISVRELLPTAHRYDPDDNFVTTSFIGGMVVMALSLILFLF